MFVRVAMAMLAALVFLGGCKNKPEDKVLAQYNRGEKAIVIIDVNELRDSMSTDSYILCQKLIALALDASEAETKALPPSELDTVITLRNRVAPDRPRRMTVEEFLAWEAREGMMVVDADIGVYPYKVEIRGDVAIMQMGIEIERESSFRVS